MPSNTSPSPKDKDDEVTCLLQCYAVTFITNTEASSVLVGKPGMYYPRHQDHMHQIPTALLKIVGPDGSTSGLLTPGTKYHITMPRWLADKKGFTING